MHICSALFRFSAFVHYLCIISWFHQFMNQFQVSSDPHFSITGKLNFVDPYKHNSACITFSRFMHSFIFCLNIKPWIPINQFHFLARRPRSKISFTSNFNQNQRYPSSSYNLGGEHQNVREWFEFEGSSERGPCPRLAR